VVERVRRCRRRRRPRRWCSRRGRAAADVPARRRARRSECPHRRRGYVVAHGPLARPSRSSPARGAPRGSALASGAAAGSRCGSRGGAGGDRPDRDPRAGCRAAGGRRRCDRARSRTCATRSRCAPSLVGRRARHRWADRCAREQRRDDVARRRDGRRSRGSSGLDAGGVGRHAAPQPDDRVPRHPRGGAGDAPPATTGGSSTSRRRPDPVSARSIGASGYAAAKAAMVGMTRALALEVAGAGDHGERGGAGLDRHGVGDGRPSDVRAAASPVGRSGTADEVAAVDRVPRVAGGVVRDRADGRRRRGQLRGRGPGPWLSRISPMPCSVAQIAAGGRHRRGERHGVRATARPVRGRRVATWRWSTGTRCGLSEPCERRIEDGGGRAVASKRPPTWRGPTSHRGTRWRRRSLRFGRIGRRGGGGRRVERGPDRGARRSRVRARDGRQREAASCSRRGRRSRPLRAAGGGAILAIASDAGIQANRGAALYCASKGAVVLFAKTLALDLARRRHPGQRRVPGRCGSHRCSPGRRRSTAVTTRRGTCAACWPGTRRGSAARFLEAAEVAELLWYLGQPAARGITGAAISIDQGLSSGI
jgi:NAD(P)-dependent dehydrogenase (short-subunit alcohol dehydrogenase family)